VVDFAHTPTSLTRALEAAEESASGRVIVVIGAAGERDPGKRAPLGKIAVSHADLAIFTEEDSRSEDTESILEEIAAGAKSAIDTARAGHGPARVLVNCAGVATPKRIVGRKGPMPLDDFRKVVEVNMIGSFNMLRLAAADMLNLEALNEGERGVIVSTASIYGLVAGPGSGHYIAAKHGVVGLTKTLALELAEYDVTVNAVCPTAVDTPMTGGIVEALGDEMAEIAEQSGPDNVLGEIVQPEDVSAAFLWLSSDDARYVTGIALPVAAGAPEM
jgi:NAD(P)-dependent dehydrogenase (short-subunit alcohol dehydrogenase family)